MKNESCDKSMSFDDCVLIILRTAVDKAQKKIGKQIINSPSIKKIISIVEEFIKKKKLICYGGTAINNILPEEDQFYDKEAEIPDYDFFSYNALKDAKELADIYYKNGFTDVEAKSGQHYGTYKVFVNYIPVADLTNIPKEIFIRLKMDAILKNGIYYAPPNFLRMNMYLELSRPAGDTSRWEKVLKRLTLLNKHYPLTNLNCNQVDFQRNMENPSNQEKIYEIVKNTLVDDEVVFFGGYAISLYAKYMPKNLGKKLKKIADFDILAYDPKKTADKIKKHLNDKGIKDVTIVKREPVGEIIPLHYEIIVDEDSVAFIYKPIACHSYNILNIDGKKVKIATIDTMLNFYLAFLYTNRPYYNEFFNRILCMANFLYEVQQKNKLEQKGLLKRFSITCYGHQESVEEMRGEKAEKYNELKKDKNKSEFEKWFLNYKPGSTKDKNKDNKQGNQKNIFQKNDKMNDLGETSDNTSKQRTLKKRKIVKTKTRTTTKKNTTLKNTKKSKSFNFNVWNNKKTKNKLSIY
jgi:hypothetical protein